MQKEIFYLNREEKKQLVEQLRHILEDQEEIVFAYLFGSFLEDLPFHDLDVGIYTEGIRESEELAYSTRLAEKLSRKIRLPVDVRILNSAPITFLYHVFQGELVREKSEVVRSQIMERTLQRYLDLKSILYQGMKEAFTA